MSEQQSKDLVDSVKIPFLRKQPFLYFMLKSVSIEYVDEDNASGSIGTAGSTITFWKNFFQNQDYLDNRLAVIAHELFHIILDHTIRGHQIIKNLLNQGYVGIDSLHHMANLAMDAKVNNYLAMEEIRVPTNYNVEDYFSRDKIEHASTEELVYELIKKHTKKIELPFGFDMKGAFEKQGKKNNGTGKGKIIQEGDKRLAGKMGDDLAKEIKKVFTENLVKAKAAGVGRGSMLRALEEDILREKALPWNMILRRYMNGWVLKSKISDWTKFSRKLPGQVPGLRVITKPRIKCLVDVSGSVGPADYTLFVREMLRVAREGEAEVTFWDDGPIETRKIKSIADMKNDVHGGGGTVLKPVLQSLKTTPGDVVVVLTDGYIGDIEPSQRYLKKMRCNKILVTIGAELTGFNLVIGVGKDVKSD